MERSPILSRGILSLRNWWARQGKIRKGIVSATAWSTAFQLASRLQSVVLVVVSARLLQTEEFGGLFVVQAVGLLGASLWDLGSTSLVVRELAAGKISPRGAVRAIIIQRLVFFLPVFGAVTIMSFATPLAGPLDAASVALVLGSSGILAVGKVYNAVLLGVQQFAKSAWTFSAGRILSMVLLSILLILPRNEHESVYIAGILVVGELTTTIAQWVLCQEFFGGPEDTRIPFGVFLRKSLPYALNSFFNYAYIKGDLLFVASLAGVVAAAAYTPASQLQNLLALIPALLTAGIVPITSSDRGSMSEAQRNHRLTKRVSRVGLIATLFFCVVLSIAMPFVMRIAVGGNYESSVLPALIIVWSLPFYAIHVPLSQALIAQGLAGKTTIAYATAFGFSAFLHLALDPSFGAVGGAFASAVRDPIVLVVLGWSYRNARIQKMGGK